MSSFVSGDAPLDAPSTNTKGNVDIVSTQKKHWKYSAAIHFGFVTQPSSFS